MAAAINQARASHGLAPVAYSSALDKAAGGLAVTMARLGVMDHGAGGTTLTGRLAAVGYHWRAAGENIAAGYATVAAVVAGWMGSPGHRANILNPAYTELGVGLARAPGGTLYWAADFATPALGLVPADPDRPVRLAGPLQP